MGTELTEKTASNRLPYLDYARVFVMYLVIFGHLLLDDNMTIRPFIYSFHMPFFFLVSGMLHKNRGSIAWKKYWKTLIVPYLFFNIIFFILWPLCSKLDIWKGTFNWDAGLISIYLNYFKSFWRHLLYGMAPPDGPTWFLLVLLLCKIITDFICRHRWTAIFIICAVAILIYLPSYRTYLRLGNTVMVLPFFYVGFKFKKEIQQWCTKRWALLYGIVFLLINIPLTILNGKVSTNTVSFGHLFVPLNAIVFYINAFSSSLGLLVVCMQFPTNKNITISAKALITILCMQNFFCYIYRYHCDQTNYLLIAITAALIFIACVLIHLFFERHLPFAVGR